MLAKYMDESRVGPDRDDLPHDPRRHARHATQADQRGTRPPPGRNEKLSFTHLVAWAIVKSVERFPVDDDGLRARSTASRTSWCGTNVDIGLAVDVERRDGSRSLLVPVVRAAETLGFRGFVDAYDDLVKRTR